MRIPVFTAFSILSGIACAAPGEAPGRRLGPDASAKAWSDFGHCGDSSVVTIDVPAHYTAIQDA